MKNLFANSQLKTIIFSLLFFGMLFMPAPAQAQAGDTTCGSPSFFFLTSWANSRYMKCEGGEVVIREINDFLGLIMWAVDSLLKLVVYVSAGFMIYGGIKYMFAQGDQGSLGEAKQTIFNAGIGLVIAIASVAMMQFVVGAIL